MDTILTMNPGSTVLFIVAAVTLAVGVIVYVRDTSKTSNIFFLFLAVLLALWSFFIGFFEAAQHGIWEGVSLLLIYLSAAGVSVILFFFSLALATEKISLSAIQRTAVLASYALLAVAILIPGFIIDGIGGSKDGVAKEILFGKGFAMYVIFITFYLLMSLGILIKRYRESAGVFKAELRNILLSAGGASILAATSNLILPLFGSFYIFWSGPLVGMFAILLIGYHIIKYNFWNMKLVATELFTTLIVLTLAVEIFLTNSILDFTVKVAITLLVIFSSIFLIRSVRNEVEAKEEVEKLLKDLAFANDELQTLDKRKSEFLSIASHHLRDPLTAIKGYASMLLEGSFGGQLSDGVKDAMQKIFESSKRLVTIIEDFLNITQIEQGEMAYNFTTIDFKKLVGEVIEELSPSASRSGLWLHFLADGVSGEGATVQADTGKVRQMVSNLVDNSIKYTPKGGVRVLLAHTEHGGKSYLQLSITDTGIGMDANTQEKIFNKFSRAEGVSKLYTDGSGLGLYVAKEILKKHNGRIWAESQGLGKGSTFFIELPMEKITNK